MWWSEGQSETEELHNGDGSERERKERGPKYWNNNFQFLLRESRVLDLGMERRRGSFLFLVGVSAFEYNYFNMDSNERPESLRIFHSLKRNLS